MRNALLTAFLTACVLLLMSAREDTSTTLFIIGDSTAANKDITGGSPERGWGMALQCYLQLRFL